MKRRAAGVLVIALAFAVGVLVPGATGARVHSAGPPAAPPNGVYTCDWIAVHPAEALQARVTCDPAVIAGTTALPVAPLNGLVQPMTVSTDVPVGARVGQGVFAWGNGGYTYYYTYNGKYSPADFTRYVKDDYGVNHYPQRDYDTSLHTVSFPSGFYYWGAQNHSDTPQQWHIVWG
jgi:hypothetical protein